MRTRFVVFGLLVSGAVLAFGAQEEKDAIRTLVNTGFERPVLAESEDPAVEPENWFFFSSAEEDPRPTLTEVHQKTGKQALYFKAPSQAKGYLGYAQRFLPQPGATYQFSVHVLNDAGNPIPAGAYAQISVEFKNETGLELERVYGPIWGSELSSVSWQKHTVSATAPEGASLGVVVITFFSQDTKNIGAFYVDDIDFQP